MEKNTDVVVYLLHSSPTLLRFFEGEEPLNEQITISFLSKLLYELLSSVKRKRYSEE